MNTKLFTLAACIAWAGVAISSASTASALALTEQTGAYAACSASYQSMTWENCGYQTTYTQNITFVQTACNQSGGCGANNGTVYTDGIYTTGRKTTSWQATCLEVGMFVYGLGSCAC
jgi:hypothetical protein